MSANLMTVTFRGTTFKMFNLSEDSSLLGPGWYILNVLRGCNIVGLLSVAVSSVVMVIKTNIINGFFVFQAFAHIITSCVALVLIVSEIPQPAFVANFYRRNWPTFSTIDATNRGHSLAWLGAWMVAMGVWVLGSLNAENMVTKLTLPLWRLTLASGILALIFGVFNFIVSVVFRNSHHGITTRMIREHGANVYNAQMTSQPSGFDFDTSTLNGSHRSDSIRKEKQLHHLHPVANSGNRFSRLFAGNANRNKPQISGPIINEPIIHEQLDPTHDVEAAYPRDRDSWEGPDRASPIAPHVQRPPTALHPAYTGRSSVYSEASHLNRF